MVSEGPTFKFQVVNGNNAKLIKSVLKQTRSQLWLEAPSNNG